VIVRRYSRVDSVLLLNSAGSLMAAKGGTYAQGVILAAMAGVVWSTIGLGVRMMEHASPFQVLLYRSAGLILTLLVFLAIRSGGHPFRMIGATSTRGIFCSLLMVIAFSGSIISLKETTVANAVFLLSTAPLMTALLGRIILGEPVRIMTWCMMLLGSIGVAIMVIEGISLGKIIGNVAALICALAFALFSITMRSEKADDSTPVVFFAGLNATVASAAAVVVIGEPLVIPLFDAAVGVGLGMFALAGGLVMFTISTRYIPAAEATLLSMTEVVLSPIWVWLLLNETMSIPSLIGGGILLSALVINAISGMVPVRPQRVPAPAPRRRAAPRREHVHGGPVRGVLRPYPAE
jgi:drug/metabolite transporter (DMT)-like permease